MAQSNPAGGKRPTLRDVAEAAGVSHSTASRAITGEGYVADHVRDRVREAADRLGYVAHTMARSLRTQSSNIIGVLVSDLRNPFYSQLTAGIARAARVHGHTIMIVDDGGDEEQERAAAAAFVATRVTGVLVTPLSGDVSEYLQRQRIPVVEVDRQFRATDCDGVINDNEASAQRLGELLVRLGHRRISMFYDETAWTTGLGRIAGFRAAIASAGLGDGAGQVVDAGWDADSSRRTAVNELTGHDRPTAIFTANNVLAEGVWRAIGDLGLSVPHDLSLVSFDDARWMSLVEPGITAVAQDAVRLGEVATEILMQRVVNLDQAWTTTVLPAEIVARGSTAPPSRTGD